MAAVLLVEVSMIDVNGVSAKTSFNTDTIVNAQALLASINTITNARIVSANVLTPLDVGVLVGNTAQAVNVETARQKLALTWQGVKVAGTTRAPSVIINVPAPQGVYVNGVTGDVTNADLVAMSGKLFNAYGVATPNLVRVAYQK